MLKIEATSTAGRAISALSKTQRDLSHGVIATVRKEAFGLQAGVRVNRLRGQSLHQRTGRLSRSITTGNEAFIFDGDNFRGMEISVGTNVSYGAYHELGFHGTQSVRAHTRQVTQVFGRSIAPVRASVRAHSRKVEYKGRPYLRPEMEQRAPAILQRLHDAVFRAFGENAL